MALGARKTRGVSLVGRSSNKVVLECTRQGSTGGANAVRPIDVPPVRNERVMHEQHCTVHLC